MEAQILRVARELLNERGYKGMTLRRISSLVGIEPQSIYNYTPSKLALVDKIMRVSLEALHTRVMAAVEQAGAAPADRLWAAAFTHTEHFCVREDFVSVRDSLVYLEPQIRDGVLVKLKQYEAIFKDIIRDGVELGEFPPADVTPVAFAIMGLGESTMFWFRDSGRLSSTDVAKQYADLALRLVVQQRSPARLNTSTARRSRRD